MLFPFTKAEPKSFVYAILLNDGTVFVDESSEPAMMIARAYSGNLPLSDVPYKVLGIKPTSDTHNKSTVIDYYSSVLGSEAVSDTTKRLTNDYPIEQTQNLKSQDNRLLV